MNNKEDRAVNEKPPEKRKTGVRGRPRLGSIPGREVLLNAAMKEFARHGFEATSLRTLAAHAGVDMALVARLFGSKADLYAAVIGRLAERQVVHRAQLAVIAAGADSQPAKAFRGLLELLTEISFEMPEFPAFLMQEVSNPGDRLDALVTQLVDPFRTAVEPIIVAANDAGVIQVEDTRLFFGMLIVAVSMPMLAPPVFSSEKKLTEKLRDQITRQAIDMFIRDKPIAPRRVGASQATRSKETKS